MLNAQQKIGLRYYEELQQRIPRAEVEQLETIVKLELKAIDPYLKLVTAGSYRRQGQFGFSHLLTDYPSSPPQKEA